MTQTTNKGVYHGVLVNKSFRDENFAEKFKLFAKKQDTDSDWILYGVEVSADDLDRAITDIQNEMRDGTWYNHFYSDGELIVIFRDKVFHVQPHASTWLPVIEYGRRLSIPEDQLSFWPNRFQDEIHYFATGDFM